MPNYAKASFALSAMKLNQLPGDTGVEVAFIGRSNSGKSSALNTITGLKGLARTSKTPGRTQAINIFDLEDDSRLVDLPGYGYAKVPLAVKEHWSKTVNRYLQTRECLHGLVLIMDIRHPLKELDEQLLAWSAESQLPVHILLTKADKLNYGAAKQTLLKVQNHIGTYGRQVSVQLFSALDKTGCEDAKQQLDKWFNVTE